MAATIAMLSGPSTGINSVDSTNFTVTLDTAATTTTTITPTGTNGAVTFTPAAPSIAVGQSSVTFTANATTIGAHDISITTSPTLTTFQSPVTYTTAASATITTTPLEDLSGSLWVSTLMNYSWFPGGRLGSLYGITPIEGTATTDANGVLTIIGVYPGPGVLMTTVRGANVNLDTIHYHQLTAV